MRNREDILHDLVHLKGNLSDLADEISQFPWDIEQPILTISKVDFFSILNKCLNNEITLNELEHWANMIECRDDLGFEDDRIQETIFELANSEINKKTTKKRLNEIMDELHQ